MNEVDLANTLATDAKVGDAKGSTTRAGRLGVMMPALNEEATIRDVIARVPPAIAGFDEIEVVVIDDGSNDGTVELAREAGAHVISHPENRGVGRAFATGIDAALKLGADIRSSTIQTRANP